MCADAQTANLFSRKLICSRSLDESLATLETSQQPPFLHVRFVFAKGMTIVGLMVTVGWLWDRRRNQPDSHLAGRGRDRFGL